MQTLYLCSSNIRDHYARSPIERKWGRKQFQCEVWANSEEQASMIAKQIREAAFPAARYNHSDLSCEAQEGVTIEGNKKAYQELGQIYEVLPNGQVVIHEENREG